MGERLVRASEGIARKRTRWTAAASQSRSRSFGAALTGIGCIRLGFIFSLALGLWQLQRFYLFATSSSGSTVAPWDDAGPFDVAEERPVWGGSEQRVRSESKHADDDSKEEDSEDDTDANLIEEDGKDEGDGVPFGSSVRPSQLSTSRESGGDKDVPRDGTFSACLLVKDDNALLPEWLAYHYMAMPLRHLILAVDPASMTSPLNIVNEWRAFGMTIEVWTSGYGFDDRERCTPVIDEETGVLGYDESRQHTCLVGRQRHFLHRCFQELRRQNRTWTMSLIDTDEFFVANNVHPTDEPNPPKKISPVKVDANLAARKRLPRVLGQTSNATAYAILEEERAQGEGIGWDFRNESCITVTRLFFQGRESNASDIAAGVPSGFDSLSFRTLRFRHAYAQRGRFGLNRWGKAIVDLARIDLDEAGGRREGGKAGVHTPFDPPVCPNSRAFNAKWYYQQRFRIHHYVGSLEQFMARPGDAGRRSAESYLKKANLNGTQRSSVDDSVRLWLENFVALVGREAAVRLLKGAGTILLIILLLQIGNVLMKGSAL